MTVANVFEYTASLIDERLGSGLVDTDATLVYKKNAPYFLTMIQDELANIIDYVKTAEISVSTEEEGYVKVTFPADYKELYQLINSNFEPQTDFRRVGDDLYVPHDFSGYLVYKPIMAELTALESTLVLDTDICRKVMPNGLASKLLTNENANMANYFGTIYEEMKRGLKKKEPSPITTIKDVYDSSLSF